MTRAMVLGGNGQDGTYLVRHLLGRGHEVVSVGLEAEPREAHPGAESFRYVPLDLRGREGLAELLRQEEPERIFHVAAVHASAAERGGSYEERFGDMLAVNVGSLQVVLEHLRLTESPARVLYASSIKAFGDPPPVRIDEFTPRRSTGLYGVTKNAGRDTLGYYRERHGVQGSVVYLGNHESPLRPAHFFIPKLVRCLADALEGKRASPEDRTAFFTLDFHCDWGSAEEYMDIAVDVLDEAPGEDFVLASGRCLKARELVEGLFGDRGLEAANFLREEGEASDKPKPYQISTEKLRRLVGRVPERPIEKLVAEMLAEEQARRARAGA